MSTTERIRRLERLSRRLRRAGYNCHDIAQNLEWDAAELRRGVRPGSATSWRSSGLNILGG